tara:strand:- start:1521 stop:2930 length:1410 start_codon:yes stop_codon:yes gene_type:complete
MFKWIIKLIPKFIKTWIANLLYDDIAAKGIGGDTELAYLTPQQEAFLKSIGGAGTYNPNTQLKQYLGPLAIGLIVGTAAFGVAKLAGMSTRNALGIGLLGGFGAGGIAALGTGGTATATGAQAGLSKFGGALGAGSTTAAQGANVLASAVGPTTAQGLSAAGISGSQAPLAMLGKQGVAGASGAFGGGSIAGAPGFMTTGLEAGKGAMMAAQGATGAGGLPVAAIARPENLIQAETIQGYTGAPAIGTVNAPSVIPKPPVPFGERIDRVAGKIGDTLTDPGTLLALGAAGLSYRPNQPVYDTRDEDLFPDMGTSEGYLRQRALIDPASERAIYEDEDEKVTPKNVYERLDVMAAKEGGLATLKLKTGGINYLPSKTDHDEKDANNYVRAMGYVEDGAGNGDKDEDTMLAQLADGEFVSRADAILGAGIMSGANPDDFKDMRRKGAQFFYKQQDSLKRVYDLVNDRNKAS